MELSNIPVFVEVGLRQVRLAGDVAVVEWGNLRDYEPILIFEDKLDVLVRLLREAADELDALRASA